MCVKYIASLDVGTTTIRCYIFDNKANVVSTASDQVHLIYPGPGRVEIEPEPLWESVVRVVRESIKAAGLTSSDIAALGISTQRSSFITWDKTTGKPFHNLVTWKDLRADSLVRKWNNSYTMKGIRAGSSCLHLVTRNKRFLAGSVLRLMNTQTTLRLCWCMQNIAPLREAIALGDARFGTLDTWLLHRMTAGRLHATDPSSASATGMFDPFTGRWAGWALTLFTIPADVLPQILDTAGGFGDTHRDVFGSPIPIACSISDQSASMWGSQCFEKGDLKVTLGTGSFLDVNTGSSPHASVSGLYPLVGWRLPGETAYVAEGAANDAGSLIEWAISTGLISCAEESSGLAESVEDSDGVFFIPAFSGLGAPVNDHRAATGFLGLRPTTTRAHLVRALLESLAFRVAQLFVCAKREAAFSFNKIRVDGGVSRNAFLCQLVADLTGLQVERGPSEMSVLGAALLAGLTNGVWGSRDELRSLHKTEQTFEPCAERQNRIINTMEQWERAVERFRDWYEPQHEAPVTKQPVKPADIKTNKMAVI